MIVVYNDQDSLFSFQIIPPVSTAFRGQLIQTPVVHLNSIFSAKKRTEGKPLKETVATRAKINNLINVVKNLLQCCAAPCQQLSSTTIVHSCSRSTIIVQSLLTTINKLFSSTIVSSCSNNIVTTIVLCQHPTSIDRTILINIVNSTSVVEP